jgi:mono/diheme cytochrome c family protein
VKKTSSRYRVILAVGLFISLYPVLASASDQTAIKLGHDIVSENCSGCHAVGKTGDSPLPTAPHFRALHERYDVEVLMEALVEGITTAHPEMPEFQFSVSDATAIVAYLKSLE